MTSWTHGMRSLCTWRSSRASSRFSSIAARIAVAVFSIFENTRSASAVVTGSVASNWSSSFVLRNWPQWRDCNCSRVADDSGSSSRWCSKSNVSLVMLSVYPARWTDGVVVCGIGSWSWLCLATVSNSRNKSNAVNIVIYSNCYYADPLKYSNDQ